MPLADGSPEPTVLGSQSQGITPCSGRAEDLENGSTACLDDAAIAAAFQAEEDRRYAEVLQRREERRSMEHQRDTGAHNTGMPPLQATMALGVDQRYPGAQLANRPPATRKRRCFWVLGFCFLVTCTVAICFFFFGGRAIFERARKSITEDYDLGDFQKISRDAFDRTNEYRAAKGLEQMVEWNSAIAEIAAEHAGQMARGEMPFSHEGFASRAAKYPMAYMSSGENLAMCRGFPDVAKCAVEGWISSPGHELNLRGDWNLMGIGTAQSTDDGTFYLTQLFALSSFIFGA